MPTYADLARSDFFSFFNVSETGRTPSAAAEGVTEVGLRPGGFQEHIQMGLRLGSRDRVLDCWLRLERDWVGDRESLNPFAKDLAKSFLAAMIDPGDAQASEGIIDQIWNARGERDEVVLIGAPPAPGRPAGLDEVGCVGVYMGRLNRFSVTLAATRIELENVSRDGREWLEIRLGPAG